MTANEAVKIAEAISFLNTARGRIANNHDAQVRRAHGELCEALNKLHLIDDPSLGGTLKIDPAA